jgi:cytochrome c oxidase subunit 1
VFLTVLLEAAVRRRKAEANPWGEGATTLEWTLRRRRRSTSSTNCR